MASGNNQAEEDRSEAMEAWRVHVLVIGDGAAGVSALASLLDSQKQLSITVATKSPVFGPGLAYCSEVNDLSYILNVPTKDMGIGQKEDFLRWARETEHEENGAASLGLTIDPLGYLPRQFYGSYLKAKVEELLRLAKNRGVPVQIKLEDPAVSLEEISDPITDKTQCRATLESGLSMDVDYVILAAGGFVPSAFPYLAEHPSVKAGGITFIPNLMCQEGLASLEALPIDAQVSVLGSSLAALDVVNMLFDPRTTGCSFEEVTPGKLRYVPGTNMRRLRLVSRSGRFPSARSVAGGTVDPVTGTTNREPVVLTHFTLEILKSLSKQGKLTAEAALLLLEADIQARFPDVTWESLSNPLAQCDDQLSLNSTFAEWLQGCIDGARGKGAERSLSVFLQDFMITMLPVLRDLMLQQLLPGHEQALFSRKANATIMVYLAPCPLQTSERLLALLRAGVVDVVPGCTNVTISSSSRHIQIGWELKAVHVSGESLHQYVVNATGAKGMSVMNLKQNALYGSMIESGLMDPYVRDDVELGGANFDPGSGFLIKSNGKLSKTCCIVGHTRVGRVFNNASLRVIEMEVDQVVGSILSAMEGKYPKDPERKLRQTSLEELIGDIPVRGLCG
ncbi:unnamed protein product [Chrysoparadoxa australica]